MMETIKTIFQEVNTFLLALNINFMYVLLWVAAGYIQKEYFGWFVKFGDAWKTLILGSLFSLIYACLLRNVNTKATWVEFLASYIFATSLYELVLKDMVNKTIAFLRSWYDKKLSQ